MARVNLINNDSLPQFMESFADTVSKGLEKMEVLNFDGLISSVPFGKLASYVARKIIQISDVEKALNKSIGDSALLTFIAGLRRYDINPVVEEVFLNECIKDLKKTSKEKKIPYLDFQLKSFGKSAVVKHYQKYLNVFTDKLLTKQDASRVKKYLKDYHKQTFLKLLEDNETVFKKLSDFIGRDSTEEIVVNFRKQAYRKNIAENFSEIILNDSKGLKLRDIYIEPQYNLHRNCFKEKDKRVVSKNRRDDKGFVRLNDSSVHEFVHDFLNSKDKLELKHGRSNILFVLGYPGQGKSSFCKKVLYDCIVGDRHIDQDIYFVKLRNLTNTAGLMFSPINALLQFINEQIDFEVNRQELKESVLILDGLDELFMKENLQTSAIDEFCRLIIRETETLENQKIIITSRYGYVNTERLKTEDVLILQLREFDLQRQKKWLSIYKNFHPETVLSEHHLDDINSEREYLYLKELISQPILLHLLATLERELEMKTNRAKIYESLFTQLIKRTWAKEGPIDNMSGIFESDLREFLREIAFTIFQSGNGYIHKSTMVQLPATVQFLEKMESRNLRDSLKRLMIAFYFQEVKKEEDREEKSDDKDDYAIEFLHNSLQEYLVAEKIWNTVITFSDKNSRTGKYNIDDEKRAFETVVTLFSRRIISPEIGNYVKEIVQNDSETNRSELADRMTKFFPGLLEMDFLPLDAFGAQKVQLSNAHSGFFGYWLVLSCVKDQKKNYIPPRLKDKFAFFLKILSNENSMVDLSFQDLSGTNLSGVDLSGSNLSYADLNGCNLAGADLSSTMLDHTSFFKADLYRATIENSYLNGTNFESANLVSSVFYNLNLNSSLFKGAVLRGAVFTLCDLRSVTFNECILEYTNFLNSKGMTLKTFEKSILLEDNCLGLTKEVVVSLIGEVQRQDTNNN